MTFWTGRTLDCPEQHEEEEKEQEEGRQDQLEESEGEMTATVAPHPTAEAPKRKSRTF